MAALYNSRLLDRYFRCINGNTQVSATELRAMRLPSAAVVAALGSRIKRMADPLSTLDATVVEMAVPPHKREVLLGEPYVRAFGHVGDLGTAANCTEVC